jgi:16S rRNA G966 N2-methylase RsmD
MPKRQTAKLSNTESKTLKPKKVMSTQVAYNDLDMASWKDYEDVSTDSLWLFDQRDKTGGHKLDYHGNCVPQILTQLLKRFTKKGDVMLDLFLGSGTSAIESERLGRSCIGVELSNRMVDYVQDKINNLEASSRHEVILGNSQDHNFTGKRIDSALHKLGKEKAQFAFLHPPYDDIIRFSQHGEDLSNQESTDDFIQAFTEVAQQAYNKLERGRFAAVVIGDKYAKSEWVPLGFMCLQAMNQVGFKTKSIVVKNMTGNERGKGKSSNLWRYRALKGGFYLFKHEYVFILQKP